MDKIPLYVKKILFISANIMNLAGLILILYHICVDPHGEMIVINPHFLNILFAFGTILFNMSSIGLVSIDLPEPHDTSGY